MAGNWRFAVRLLTLVVLGGFVSVVEVAGSDPDRTPPSLCLAIGDALEGMPAPASDASGDQPGVLIIKASLRKAARRLVPSRSVLRSAPDSIAELQAGSSSARVRIAAAVQAANAADILRLCRWLL